MESLTQYGRMAERHWREFLPRMVADLEAKGTLRIRLMEAELRTDADLDSLRRHLVELGFTSYQAHLRAWEIVRNRYLFLPPEE